MLGVLSCNVWVVEGVKSKEDLVYSFAEGMKERVRLFQKTQTTSVPQLTQRRLSLILQLGIRARLASHPELRQPVIWRRWLVAETGCANLGIFL